MKQSSSELFFWGAGVVVSVVAMTWVARFVLRGPIKDDAEFKRRVRNWRRAKPFWKNLFGIAPMDTLSSIERPMVYEPTTPLRRRRQQRRRRRKDDRRHNNQYPER